MIVRGVIVRDVRIRVRGVSSEGSGCERSIGGGTRGARVKEVRVRGAGGVRSEGSKSAW